MINTKFELYKLRRTLNVSGKDFVFYRRQKNKFNELNGEKEEVATVRCLYHETNGYKTLAISDGTLSFSEKKPMLLCAVEDIKESGIEYGDFIEVDDNVYGGKKELAFVGVDDILDFGIIADISLEVVDYGRTS